MAECIERDSKSIVLKWETGSLTDICRNAAMYCFGACNMHDECRPSCGGKMDGGDGNAKPV